MMVDYSIILFLMIINVQDGFIEYQNLKTFQIRSLLKNQYLTT